MKILVCGASGILGKEICKKLELEKINFIGTYNKNKINKLNYYNFEEIDDLIIKEKPTIIINCIVNRLVDECENNWNEIKKINIDIADKLSKYNIKIIHISTDYVFDGLNPPYYDTSLTNPIQNYGMSKLLAELRVINNTNNYLIIRVPVLFTDNYNNLNENAIVQICKKMMDLTIPIIKEDDACIRRPLYIPILVNFIYDSIIKNYNGIYHFYNPIDKTTKYKMALEIKKIINKNNITIEPNYILGNRPFDTELRDNKYDINYYYNDINTNLSNLLNKCFSRYYHNSNLKDCFLLIDLDGTLINSENQHYECYKELIGLSREDFDNKNQNNNLDFENEIKIKKDELFKTKIKDVKLINGALEFLTYIINNKINYCIVTNTNNNNVRLYKEHISILSKLTNWISKEDYINKKPNPECYNLAISRYYKNEKYIIGIENTIAGYEALKKITDIIYIQINNNKKIFNNCDAFLINNLNLINNNHNNTDAK
jgi:dTDP-4-dehydrorhamnose reductase/beta-phosphoglucomutase-like phosphatase (HAD superfamily)